MLTEIRKPKKSGKNRKRSSNHAAPQSYWLVGVAISTAVVMGYFVVQTQKRLETVQSELHRVSENAVQAKAAVVDLEQTTARLKRELNKVHFKRNELVDAAAASRENLQTRLESMRSELEGAKQSAEQAEAEAARSKEELASLKAKLDETNAKRRALLTELQLAHSDVKQLRSELITAKSELVEVQSRLRSNQNELEDARGKAKRGALRKELQTEKLKKDSLAAASPAAEQANTAPDHGYEGRDYLIRTIVFEASGETEIGKAAVAHVILNRKRKGRWGDRIQDVVTHPWQFEPWMTRADEIKKLSPNDPCYRDAAVIADAVLAGLVPDPTAGATHFLNPVVVRQRRGGSLPSWADGDGQPIGRHVFYSPDRDGKIPQRAASRRLQPSIS